jgi:hypothetical protein
MCDVVLIVDELLIPFNTLAESEKIMKFCSEYIFSIISSVSPIACASAMNVDAILAIVKFPATTIFYIYRFESYEWFGHFRAVLGETFSGSRSFLENLFEFLVVILCSVYLSSLIEKYSGHVEEAFVCVVDWIK